LNDRHLFARFLVWAVQHPAVCHRSRHFTARQDRRHGSADPRILGSLPAVIVESADQNGALNLERLAAVDTLNAEIAGSAVFMETNNMSGGDWGPNESGASFSQSRGFHYHARAENFLEIGWLTAGAVLDNGFLSPMEP